MTLRSKVLKQWWRTRSTGPGIRSPITRISRIPPDVSGYRAGCICHCRGKETGLLDYQRMTPMSPFSKIGGYLFGLPAREYFMFFLTIPFLIHCVIVGKLPWLNIVHLYSVFFCSVLFYHLTAHVIGLVVPPPGQPPGFRELRCLVYIFSYQSWGRPASPSFLSSPFSPLISVKSYQVFSLLGKISLEDLSQKLRNFGRMYPFLISRYLLPHLPSSCRA